MAYGFLLILGGLIYLIQAIRIVTNGQTVYESRLVKGMFDKSKCPLNKRELQILNVMKKFSNTKQIAQAVFLAEGTVRNYISAIEQDGDQFTPRSSTISKRKSLDMKSPYAVLHTSFLALFDSQRHPSESNSSINS